MSIAPFSFKEFGLGEVEFVTSTKTRPFLPTGRSKEEAPPPPPPPPTFSEDELKTAERDGYQKGFLEGITEGKNQEQSAQAMVDRNLTDMVQKFASYYTPMFAMYRDMLRLQAEQLPKMAHAIAKKVAGEALDKNAYAMIEDVSLRCAKALLHEPKLVITLHESMQNTLQAKLAQSMKALNITAEIVVVGDGAIDQANCRVEWRNGAMIRDTETLWQQVEQIVNSMIASAGNEAGALANAIEIPKGE